jgi:hypothetical protein
MTIQQAVDKGYSLRKGPFFLELDRNGHPVMTWWLREFGGEMPKLDHSLIQEAIRLNEPPVAPGRYGWLRT